MKWNRWIIKAAKIITKFTELGYWMMAALMLTAGIYSFADRTFLADALAGSIRTGRLELSVLGFEFSVPTANGIDMRAMLLYFAAAVVLPSLMAMIFRNLYLIIKRSESSTVFQADNIRMLREIGIFAISMENIQNKSALIPSDEIRSEELLAEQKFEAFITSLAHIIEKYGMRVLGEVDGAA